MAHVSKSYTWRAGNSPAKYTVEFDMNLDFVSESGGNGTFRLHGTAKVTNYPYGPQNTWQASDYAVLVSCDTSVPAFAGGTNYYMRGLPFLPSGGTDRVQLEFRGDTFRPNPNRVSFWSRGGGLVLNTDSGSWTWTINIDQTFQCNISSGDPNIPVLAYNHSGANGPNAYNWLSPDVWFYLRDVYTPEPPEPEPCQIGSLSLSCGNDCQSGGHATATLTTYGISDDCEAGSPRMTISSSPSGLSGSTSSTRLTVNSSSLQCNTRYSVRANATNGATSTSASCSFVTPASNTLSNAVPSKSNTASVDATICGGYGVYEPTTVFKYRKVGESTWHDFFTSHTKTKTTATTSELIRDTDYEFQACTSTSAGTCCGNTLRFRTPPGAYALIDCPGVHPYIVEDEWGQVPPNVRADVPYHWTADCQPLTVQLFYRVKNGFETQWRWTELKTFETLTGNDSVTIIDLNPAMTYEIYAEATGCDGVSWQSPICEFLTPPLKSFSEYVCDNLKYMLELICQAYHAIKHGNMTIYANNASKEQCDYDSDHPTLAVLWSRFFRWGAEAACVMCEMIDFVIKSGKKDQYFTGELGWVNIMEEVKSKEEDENAENLIVMSKGIREFIDASLHEVWHYHGAVDYGVDDLDHIPDGAKTVLNFADDKVYELVDGNWVESTTIPQPDDFAVYHFNYENKTKEVGTIKAESAWYYWEDTWNNLDVNIDWMVKVIDEMYTHIDEFAYTEKCTDRLHIRTDPYDGFDCNTLVAEPRRTLDFILEPFEIAPPGYHLIKFETGADATIIQNQEVLDGALAQQPNTPEKYCMDFVEWQDKANLGTPFDWTQPIHADYTLEAIWAPHPVKITYNLGDKAQGTVPPDRDGFCGDAIGTLPTDAGFSRPGGTFMGWAIDGVEIDASYVMESDKTAQAIWKMQEFDVTFVLGNGDPNVVKTVEYEETAEAPDDPTRTDYIFTGWYTDAAFTTAWDDTAPIYADTTVYAGWIPAYYTVTFDSNGGSPVPSQQVAYEGIPTQPADPTKDGYILKGWILDGTPYNFDVPVTEDITLIATWNKVWTVTFDPDGGEPTPDVQVVIDGELANTPQSPTKEGCEFGGWYDASGEEPDCQELEEKGGE